MNRIAAPGTLGLVAATALVGAPFAPLAGAATPRCFGETATITGSGFIQGTRGRDVIVAGHGSEVHAYGGNDLVCGAFLTYAGPGDDRVRYGGDVGRSARRDRLQALAPDPADAGEAESRPCRDRAHAVTSAFRKSSGRVRSASKASASRSSGKRWV